jgi:predicted nicotinamide N-methyase
MKYKFNGDFTINGRPLILEIDPLDSQRSHLATGLRIWDGGIVLAKYLERRFVPQALQQLGTRQLRGLELGCGTGVAAISFALMGQQALLSDIGELQAAQTQGNISRNAAHLTAAGGSASYTALDWTGLPERDPFGFFDVVFASDVIWHETLVKPFLDAINWAASGPGVGEVVLSHKLRDEESVKLWERQLAERGFTVKEKVASEQLLGDDGHPDVFLYHLCKR